MSYVLTKEFHGFTSFYLSCGIIHSCLSIWLCVSSENAAFLTGGFWATIQGSSLEDVSLVLFGSQSCTINVTTSNSRRIQCKVPPLVSGILWHLLLSGCMTIINM